MGQNLHNHAMVNIAAHLPGRSIQSANLRELQQTTLRNASGADDCGAADPMPVVDGRTRDHGRLRAIDGSVMPTLVRSNTALPIWMIAEKGAAMALKDQA